MKTSIVIFSLLLLGVEIRADNEIGFIEKFALATDRAAVLTQLIPGSEEYYFFHALHFQSSGQKEKLKAMMDQWKARFPQSNQRLIIESREALLAYDADPKTTLQFLRDRLGLEFNHEQQVRDRKPDLPTALDQGRISREAFQQEALRDSEDLAYFDDITLEGLARGKTALTPGQHRALLQRLKRPDLSGLLDLIIADLKTKESKGFGEFEIHRALLPEQLDELATRMPALYDSQAFVFTRLRKMFPSADADAEFDPMEREAWLDRVWGYAKNLGPAFNTLKAHILYARLQHDRTRGVYDKARFLEYLKLPRRVEYMRPEYVDKPLLAAHPVDLNANLAEVLIGAGPIGNDEWLVRDYLIELLKNEASWEAWTTYLRESYVKAIFAESKIVHGIGEPEKWAALLDPSAFQQLKERVDIDFSPGNPQFHAPNDEVALDLFVKNAPKLIVKIYEINTLSFFLTQNRQLNTDINLDGLVANSEKTHDFSGEPAGANPFRRIARKFTFPELKGKRGAWVMEFIGGGKSSRALVRKGQWHVLQQTGPSGDVLTIVDEGHKAVGDAVVWFEGRKFTHPTGPDVSEAAKGAIIVPFANQPGTKPIILADNAGQFATLTTFQHHSEKYTLDAQFHVEREQLLARREATLAVRTALLLGDAQVAPTLLQEPKLKITSTTLDGVSATREFTDVKLDAAKVFTHTFTVPDRLATLKVELAGKIDQVSAGGEKQELSASRIWEVNGIDRTEATMDGHFSQFENHIVFELLGKNGEPLADQQIIFDFRHEGFGRPLQILLRTDERGRVDLGTLTGIETVHARIPGERVADCHFAPGLTVPQFIHAKAGTVIRTPWLETAAKLTPLDVSLLEKRGDSFTKDYFDAMSLTEGFIEIKGLPPGDYSLFVRREGRPPIEIRVTAGEAVNNWLLGSSRFLELRNPAPLHIQSVTANADAVVIQVRNVNKFTRVHVSATRFLPAGNLFESLGRFTRFDPGLTNPPQRPNLFNAGRIIGDEFRYILERRYTKLFPGNMLNRPALLLNPWEIRSTDLLAQTTAPGQAAARSAGDREKKLQEAAKTAAPVALQPNAGVEKPAGPNLDFLANAAPTIYNLVPDESGAVRIDRKLLGDRQHLQVYAEDLTSAVMHEAALAEAPTKFQDLRLARNLDPQKDFTERKQITLLGTGQTLTLADILTSEFETYDSLAKIYTLFTTLGAENHPSIDHLTAFAWVLQWPKLKDEEKRAKYSEFACHELSFFLSRKDPAFFQQVIQPYLRNKKDKTFMDDYLLGANLARYLEPWLYARLNVAERALLAQRLPGEAAATARHLRELYDLLPPDPEREDFLFDTALRSQAMEAGGAFAAATAEAATLASVPGLEPAAHPTNAPAPAVAGALTVSRGLARRGLAEDEVRLQLKDGLDSPEKRSETVRWAAQENAYYALGLESDVAAKLRKEVRQFYRALGPTKEWAENNYYKLPIGAQNADLIPINAFWRDFAAWDGKGAFLSEHIADASRNFSEMMLALGVLDLPFEPGKHETKSANGQFTITAASPLVALHKEIKPTPPAAQAQQGGELLVSENFFRHGDRHRIEGNEKFDKYVSDEFLAGVVYGGNIVVTNPTSSPQKLELLLQIPRGARPVLGSKATDSKRLRLEPYTTQTFEYFFYFPAPGGANEEAFPHYPVHVARNEQTVGAGKPLAFKVVKQLSKIDTASWDYVSQYGSEGEVLTFLDQNNLGRIDLERVAWRVRRSVDFFRKLIALLEKRHFYSEVIYRYAVVHNETAPLREWLRHRDDFLAQCGPWFASKLLRIDPIERRAYEHLEYSPLVNQRAHKLGGESRIPNPIFRAQYQSLLGIIAYKPALDAMDEMSVVYYLFLQDRVEEALARFATIKPEALPTRLQHDYFRCYAAFFEEKLADARTVAAQYAAYPVDRWRKLFTEVIAQLDEIEDKAVVRPGDDQPNREARQSELTSTEPSFDFSVENRMLALTWRNIGEVTINYYLMDPEFLFSSSPFVTEDPGRFAIIKPSKTATQTLPAGKDALSIPLPPEFQRANVLVEVLGAGQRKAQAYHANTLKLNLTQNYGRLEVRDEAANKTIAKAYVKVYARLKSGQIRFFKDGYTDLRGRFDYASLNSSNNTSPREGASRTPAPGGEGIDHQMLRPSELGEVEKLALLILSETNGAAVKEVNPPSQ